MTNTSPAAEWERLAPLPEPNGGFLCAAVNDDLIIAGGTNWKDDTKRWLDRIWVFEPRKNTWRDAGRLPAPLAYAASGQTKDGFYFAGGSSGTQTHTTLSMLDRKFAVKTIATITPRFVYSASAVLDARLYVIGGAQDQAKLETMTNACYRLDLKSGKAARLADLPSPGFVTGTAAACTGRVFVFGGARWDAGSNTVANLDGTFAYSPKQDHWESLAPSPFAVRGVTAITLDDHHIFIAGGYKNDVEEFTDAAFVFDTRTGAYRPAKPLPYRSMVGLVKSGDWLYCLGGEDRKKHRTDAAWRIRWRDLVKPGQ